MIHIIFSENPVWDIKKLVLYFSMYLARYSTEFLDPLIRFIIILTIIDTLLGNFLKTSHFHLTWVFTGADSDVVNWTLIEYKNSPAAYIYAYIYA